MPGICYQLYSSRNFRPLAGTLAMLRGLGYAGVEGYGALFSDAANLDELRSGLDATGLTMPSAHIGLDLLEGDPDRVLALAREFGIACIFCPYLAPEDRPTSAQGYRAFGRRLARAGEPLVAAGVGFGWHNHDFEFLPLADGAVPMAEILAGAGPDLEWEADIAWIVKGGADPGAWISAEGRRITAVHVKDIAPDGQAADEDGWADPGHGTMDWGALFGALAGCPARIYAMEHDNPADHRRFATRAAEAARALSNGRLS